MVCGIDLDSTASSIAYSYLSSTLLADRMIPLSLTPSSQMRLRPENLLVLKRSDIPINSLLHPENLPPSPSPNTPSTSALATSDVHFALVDHNRLLPIFGPGIVDGIIDHHEDERAHLDAKVRVIQFPTGSCASLVVRQFREQWEASLSGPAGVKGSPVDPNLATLLLGSILIDTGGLKAGGKATKTDYEAAEFLYPLSNIGNTTTQFSAGEGVIPNEIESYTKELLDTKFNVEGMSTHDLLLRDYKEYVLPTASSTFPILGVGLSTVPLALKLWLEQESSGWSSYMARLDEYMSERNIDIEGVLTTYQSEKKNKHKRELLLVVRSGGKIPTPEDAKRVLEELSEGLEASGDILDLGEWKKKELKRFLGKERAELDDDVKGRWGRVWQQGNAKATRKQVAPIIVSSVGQLGSANTSRGIWSPSYSKL